MVLFGPSEMVRKILMTAGIDSIVPIADDWTSAKAGLQPG
jgi:hypothetical protein